MGKFVIRKTATGYKFDLKAANGQTIATSEVYETEAACRAGVESVRKNGSTHKLEDLTAERGRPVTNPKFELFVDRGGAYRFRLKARNGAVIAVSEGYTSRSSCLNGIDSVRIHAPDAEILSE